MHFSDKQKHIIRLLADGQFHSGTDLADALGVSRSAICKQLKSLSELGLHHVAISGKGYRLAHALDLLDENQIASLLTEQSRYLLDRLEIHDSLHSTNTYLSEQTEANTALAWICLAEQQTAGKGRRGRQWVSPYGCNIYLSIRWCFQQGGMASTQGLSLAVGVAVMRALQQSGITQVGLKWPNDIYSVGKKLGGILIEVSGEADGPCTAVIGLGLNLYLPEIDAQNITQTWTDLSKIQGDTVIARNNLIAALINHLLPIINGYEIVGLNTYLAEWRYYDCLQGQAAVLYVGQQVIEGVVLGVDDKGLLLMQKADGLIQAFASGEVSFSPAV